MTRKTILISAGASLLVALIGITIAAFVRNEPDFYGRCALPPGQDRKKSSGEFQSDMGDMLARISAEEEFDARFTDLRVNSYLEEDFVQSGIAKRVLPDGISHPRVAIEPDKIRVAFRYGKGPWSTIVSIDLRVWLADPTRNIVGLELQALNAGSLPVSAQSLLERISDAARQQNIEVTWYRMKGNPVALLRFQADRARPTMQIQHIELRLGEMVIRGCAANNSLQAMLPMAHVTPVAAE